MDFHGHVFLEVHGYGQLLGQGSLGGLLLKAQARLAGPPDPFHSRVSWLSSAPQGVLGSLLPRV